MKSQELKLCLHRKAAATRGQRCQGTKVTISLCNVLRDCVCFHVNDCRGEHKENEAVRQTDSISSGRHWLIGTAVRGLDVLPGQRLTALKCDEAG